MKDEEGIISVTESYNCFSKYQAKRGRLGRKFSDNVYAYPYFTY